MPMVLEITSAAREANKVMPLPDGRDAI